jgi:hypothetical protein
MEYIHTLADGSTVKYTEDMIKNAITDRDYYQGKYHDYVSKVNRNREAVYQFFKDRYTAGDEDITVTVDDVNDLLESIGSEKLKALFTVSGTINFTVSDVEAESEDDAREIVEQGFVLHYESDGSLDDWDVEVVELAQQ